MLKSVKDKIYAYFNNNPENNVQSGRNLKRRYVADDLDKNPLKRRKADIPKAVWARIYDYVIGGPSCNNMSTFRQKGNMPSCRQRRKTNSTCKKNIVGETFSDLNFSSQPPEQSSFVFKHQKQYCRQRRILPQISKASIIDLTTDCESADDDVQVTKVINDDVQIATSTDDDVQVTKVSVDLSQNPSDYQVKKNQRTKKMISQRASNVLETSPLTENFRLEEKKRYKEILAQYTSVTLPDYSNVTISSTDSTPIASPVGSFRRSIAESINTSPLFEWKTQSRNSTVIDLTEPSQSPPRYHQRSSNRKYLDLITPGISLKDVTYIDSSESNDSSYFQSSNLSINETTKRSTDVGKSYKFFDDAWIKKFRDVLDPVQLERERRIKHEEQKTAVLKKKQQEEFEALSKKLDSSDEFPDLSEEILAKVNSALSPGNGTDVFVEGFNAQITRADVTTLRDSAWLNDEVVNFYFNLVKERNQEKDLAKVHVFNTFFYPKIMKSGHSSVKRWTRKVDIFAMDVILIPVHLGMHWCLAVIDFKNKEILYYDSLGGNNPACLQALSKYVQDESLDKKKVAFDMTGWKQLMPKDIPEQMNGCDCGVFMCKYAEYKSRYAKFTFKQDNMPYFRKRMIYEILTKKLMQ